MFKTRLNPTKPPAAHRAVLERVGAACRELRSAQEAWLLQQRPMEQVAQILAKHRVFCVGVPTEFGGAGDQPLLVVLAAERIGREGPLPLAEFMSHLTAAITIARRGTMEQKEHYLRRTVEGSCPVSPMTFRELGLSPPDPATDSDGTDDYQTELVPTFAILTARLVFAARDVGAMAESIETLAQIAADKTRSEEVIEGDRPIERFFGHTAADLEAGRAIVYAAAELLAEYDRRPTSKHLELEATTLVSEAKLFVECALERMLARAADASLGGSDRILHYLPRQLHLTGEEILTEDERWELMEKDIATYYLFR